MSDVFGPSPAIAAEVAQGAQLNSSGGNTQINFFGPAAPPDPWPVVVGSLPVLASALQSRAPIRDRLGVTATGTAGVVPTQLLVGSGGTGKTQLAASMAYQALDAAGGKRDLVIWVTAASRGSIQSSYAEAARRLGLSGADGNDVVRDAEVLLAWLTTTTRSWLVVLDDIVNLRDVDGLWPRGSASQGHVIATTRRKDPALTGGGRTVMEVHTFTPAESAAYLAERLSLAGFEELLDDSVPELTEALGHLPLALSHVAAYLIRKQRLSCADYLARYRAQSTSLAELMPGWADAEGYGRPVAVTLTLGLDAADATPPAGGTTEVMRVASMLDPAGHPVRLWDVPSIAAHVAAVSGAATVSADEMWDLCLTLHSYGLLHIDRQAGSRAVSIHAVTARAVRESIPEDDLPQVVASTADALTELWPVYHHLDAELVRSLRANVEALSGITGDLLWAAGKHRLLYLAGSSLFDAGLQVSAVSYWRQLAATATRLLGPEHPEVFEAHAQLGRAQGHAGDPSAAVQTLREVTGRQQAVLGAEDPRTLATLQDLARWRGHGGDALGALAATEAVVEACTRVLSPRHPQTLESRRTLARWRGEAGDAQAAADGIAAVLEDMLEVMGPDHPSVLRARNNLAYWRGEAGDVAGATEALAALLVDRERVLGPAHPDSLNTRNNLAYWRGEAGDSAGAVRELEQLLADRTRILGPNHPHTLATRSNLAYWRGKSGDVRTAATEFRALLPDRIAVLGRDHPDTLDTRANLARWTGEAEGPASIAAAFEELLIDRLRVLGPDHPDTLTTRHEVARWRGHGGDAAAAVRGLAEVVPDRVRVLGSDHPDTLATRHELARWRGETGNATTAVDDLRTVLDDRLRVLGPTHPHTLVSYAELGRWQEAIGDVPASIAAWENAFQGRRASLGTEHPHTVQAGSALARLRGDQPASASRSR
ncbi:tetratricopeptide repeat protein [Micromonospora zamorensis]|uniref:tetratricopeptide repeat protein n=1 Tax=Micromonospora zamorensis TaxID=709883 RepID=UPI00339FE5F9